MDKSSPVFENFNNKMSAMSSRPKINRNTFNIGANVLEKRVENNSRKITLLKNILKSQKIDIGEKLKKPEIDRQAETSEELASINATLQSIGNILSTDYEGRIGAAKERNKELKNRKQNKLRAVAESGVESVKKIGRGLGKITSPVQQSGSGILKALSLLGLGVIGNSIFEFLKTDFGQEKLGEFFDFLKNNWKWMVGTIVGVTGLLALGSLIGAIKGIGLGLVALKAVLPLLAIGGLFAAGYFIPKLFPSTTKSKTDNKVQESVNEVGAVETAKRLLEERNKKLNDRNFLQNFLFDRLFSEKAEYNKQLESLKINNPELSTEIDALIKQNKNKIPKITEVTFPVETLTGREKIVTPELPVSNDVSYITSINLANDHMTKTPKIHGIIL
tara:strand:- start:53 stop:1219 length:1167 start_codon:yes stop_codon:yes gene_type:complete